MIRNSEAFYLKAKQYQDKRAQLVSDYESKLEQLKRYEGSVGYREDWEKIQKEHAEALTALQNEYKEGLGVILRGMDEALQRRPINPPTNDQLNLIHLLKSKKTVTAEELDRVAVMVCDNSIAMSILQEIAHDSGIKGRDYRGMCKEMSTAQAREVLKDISDGLVDWLQHDTSKAGRMAQQHHIDKYGAVEQIELRKRDLFKDQAGCYRALAGLDQEDMKRFAEAIDCE